MTFLIELKGDLSDDVPKDWDGKKNMTNFSFRGEKDVPQFFFAIDPNTSLH